MAARPAVSVVVITYNDAARLPRAVRSLYAQTLRDLEIIVVDDASTDDTHDVCARFPGVRYIRRDQNSGGCGAPRNMGLDAARAPYVMFLDSDDELPRHACKALLTEIERTGADFVSGQIMRVYEASGTSAPYYPELFTPRRVVEGIRAEPELFLDGFSTNKIYDVDFLRRSELRFRENLHYEDHVFTAELYARAKRFAVVPWAVYRWYRASGEGRSISLSLRDVANVRARVSAAESADQALRDARMGDLVGRRQYRFIQQDLRVYLNALPKFDAVWAKEMAAVVRPYLERLDQGVLERADPMTRVCGELLLRDRVEDLCVAARSLTGPKAPPRHAIRVDGLTYWGTEPDPAFEITAMRLAELPYSETRLRHEVTEVSATGSRLSLSITTYDPFGVVCLDAVADLIVKGRRTRLMPRRQPDGTILTEVDLDLATIPPGACEPRLGFTRPLDGHTTSDKLLVNAGLEPLTLQTKGYEITARPCGDTATLRLHWRRTGLLRRIARRPRFRPHAVRMAGLPMRLRKRLSVREVKLAVYKVLIRLVPRKNDLVLFEADCGKGYTGHPRYLHEEVTRRGLGLRAVWSRTSGVFPGDVPTVRRMSWRHIWTMARAGWWVDSHGMPLGFPKPRKTRYLQTWHGQGIKSIGLNAPDLRGDFPGPREEWRANVARWDFLVSPSAEFERTFVPSNEYDGPVLRFGSPRCDVLFHGDPEAASRVRRKLEVPSGKKIILYAPTYRDLSKGASVRADLRALAEELGDEWVVVLRTHPIETWTVPENLRWFVRAAGSYPEVNDLMLAADVLVTDYSSLMCDFAVTGKPMVFLIDDWDTYRKTERGSLYDLPAIAPGPCVTTTGELAEAIRAPWSPERYAAFRRTWCADERGHAAARVVDAFFEGRAPELPVPEIQLPTEAAL
ncbi:CDP-glycerol:glycerophosphate glycerophosphotransferase [Herbidospora mongoliensis]|uniref:CDP-glycerol:glycerophosphate glycerophosphotransferase n=1 Tax=Herbidospora mongoliensis TaxID=688067 RepID=UPI000830FB73|nr:CDP-glycerol glycerophosphotransferase family protein [Herbidospora mongoliensis]